MSELKPCPFCGGKAEYIEDDGNHHYAECEDCGTSRGGFAYTPTEFRTLGIEGIRERTSEAWNTRAAPKVKALEWSVEVRGSRTSGIMGENYEINMTSKGYDLWLDRDDQCADLIGNYETLEKAKAAAQSYYETQILEALE
jgi:hypothetical protein